MHLESRKLGLSFFAVTVLTLSCAQQRRDGQGQVQSFTDAETIQKLGDGTYEVACSNGKIERHTLEEIRAAAIDPSSQAVCDPTRKLRCLSETTNSSIFPVYFLANVEEGVVTRYGTLTFANSSQCETIANAAQSNESYRCWMVPTQEILPVWGLYQFTARGFVPLQDDISFSQESQCQDFYSKFSKTQPTSKQCWMVRSSGIFPEYGIWEFDLKTYTVRRFAGNMQTYPTLSACQSILQ
jgi:hypothetical protein